MYRWRAFFAALTTCLLLCQIFPRRTQTAATFLFPNQADNTPVLILDPGHGGEDGGAVSLSGESESLINLAVALRVDQILGLWGVPVTMTRQEDISLHSPQANTLREKKRSDLQERTNMIQKQNNAILLSIHQNSYPDSRYSGAQVFFAPTEGSEEFAVTMQDTLKNVLNPHNNRQPSLIPESIYLMNHISCCAVLVECGFLSNPKEERQLLDAGYQTKLATALAGGYLRYQNQSQMIRNG